MAEGARLESVYRVTPIGGSNPPLSVLLASSSDDEDRIIKKGLFLKREIRTLCERSEHKQYRESQRSCIRARTLSVLLASSSDDEDRIIKKGLFLKRGIRT